MSGKNCWEVKGCERQLGGAKVSELGVCPASTDVRYNDTNGGVNAGRICWSLTGTFCNGKAQGTFAKKIVSCLMCNFLRKVRKEQRFHDFRLMKSVKNYN